MSKKKSYRNQSLIEIVLVTIILLAINILGSSWFKRVDLTDDHRFTISAPTKQMLKDLKHVVTIKIYLTGDLPPGFVRLKNAAKELLDEYKVYAGSKLTYEFVDELSGKSEDEKQQVVNELMDKKIDVTNLMVKNKEGSEQKLIVPAAMVYYLNREIPVQLLEAQPGLDDKEALNLSESLLEYKFSSGIRNALKEHNENIAFISGHGESSAMKLADLLQTLDKHSFDLANVDITKKLLYSADDPPKFDQKLEPDSTREPVRVNFDLAIIAKPKTAFSDEDKFKIDQFIMHGGKVIWLIDRTTAETDSLQGQSSFIALDRQLNIDDLLFTYGVRLNTDLVTDFNCNQIQLVVGEQNGVPQLSLFPFYYFPMLRVSSDHPIVQGLDPVTSKYAGTIDTVRARGIQKTVLLTTSEHSKAQLTPVNVDLKIIQANPGPEQFQQSDLPVAVLLEGQFKSSFTDQVPKEFLARLDSVEKYKFVEKSQPNKMIVISDGDIIENQLSKNGPYPLGWDKDSKTYFSNKQFLLNSIEYLTDGPGLMPTEHKVIKMRLLDNELVEEQKTQWQIINIIVPIAAVLLFGVGYNFMRRRKYAR